MNITVDWDNESKTILRYTFRARWGWEDFFSAVDQAKAMLDTAPGDVGVIMDGESRTMRLPPNALMNLRVALRRAHPKTRLVVIVLDNPYLNMMLNTLVRISGSSGEKLKVVGTLGEARRLIEARLRAVP